MSEKISPDLQGIPETMLWTLHNRASSVLSGHSLLQDDDAVRIYQSIDYDYEQTFGKADGSHALRSKLFDNALKPWLEQHPKGQVVELACGLETQFQRCDNGQVNWLCVDVPEAIAIRQRFLPETERCRHFACNVLDTRWLQEVATDKNIFISAQGLLMYFEAQQVQALLSEMDQRLRNTTFMFDVIPPMFSKKTMQGYWKTPHYKAPPMPWGIACTDILPRLQDWMPSARRIERVPYGITRNGLALVIGVLSRIPGLRNFLPYIVKVTLD